MGSARLATFESLERDPFSPVVAVPMLTVDCGRRIEGFGFNPLAIFILFPLISTSEIKKVSEKCRMIV